MCFRSRRLILLALGAAYLAGSLANNGGATRELGTFEEIISVVLDEFGVLSASFDLKSCDGSDELLLTNMVYLEHLNNVWLYGKLFDGTEVLRATDFYLEGKWTYVHTVLTKNGEVSLNFINLAGGDLSVLDNVTVVCKIGEGAHFLVQNEGIEREEFGSYKELKEAILSGRDLVARAEVSLCPGPNWPELGIDTFQAGYRIKDVRIEDEGTPEEIMRFDISFFNDEYSSFVTSPVALENVAHTIKPSGSARIVPGAIDLYTFEVDHWFSIGYNCTIGSSFRVSSEKNTETNVRQFDDYAELEVGLKAGHTVGAVMDARLCDWEGEKPEGLPEIIATKFSPWIQRAQIDVLDTYLEFFGLNFRSDPKKVQENFWVFDNNTVFYEILTIDPAGETQTLSSAWCSLGSSINITSSGNLKEAIGNVADLETAAQSGSYLTWLVDYGLCDGPELAFEVHGGGLLANLVIDTETGILHSSGNVISTFLASEDSVRIQQPVTINPDGEVTIVTETFTADASFEQIGDTMELRCKFGEGVQFFF